MSNNHELTELIKRMKSDAADHEGINPGSWGLNDYLQELLEGENIQHPAAVGSAKRAISEGVNALSESQLKALALDILNNDMYMGECPNEWCGEKIAWGDMNIALWEGQCGHCEHQQEKFENE